MALQIAQWNLELNLTGIPASRAYTTIGSGNGLILPTEKNVLIKKIAIDCIYNLSGDICISDFYLRFYLLHRDNSIIRNNNAININGFGNSSSNTVFLNKKNPIANINEIGGGFYFDSSPTFRGCGLKLNNSVNPITSTVSFLLSVYYAN